MAWGQAEQQSRQAAQEIFLSIANLEKELARLQEQQKKDDERFKGLKHDITEIRTITRELATKISEFNSLLERIQYIEMKLTTFWKDGMDEFVSYSDFVDYQEDLATKSERLRLAVETEKARVAVMEAEKIKSIRRQWGIVGGGLLFAGIPFLPKLWDFLAWIIHKIQN